MVSVAALHCPALPCTPQPETCIRQYRQGLGAGTWASEIGTGERTGVGHVEMAWGRWSPVQPWLGVYAEEVWANLETSRHCLGSA